MSSTTPNKNADPTATASESVDLEYRRVQSTILVNLQRILHAAERRVDRLLRAEGLDVTPAQANVLLILIAEKQPMTARKLAEDMELSQVTVGRFVKALEKGGWVSRSRDERDARAILVEPTPKALKALGRFVRVSNATLDAAFEGIGRGQVEVIAQLANAVRENLRGEP